MKKFIVAAFAVMAMTSMVFAEELISSTTTWYVGTGDGATVTPDNSMGDEDGALVGPLDVSVDLPAEEDNPGTENDVWPYASFEVTSYEGDFAGLSSIEISYTSTDAWKIDLNIPALSDDGTGYSAALTSGSHTETIQASTFKRPGWATSNPTYNVNCILDVLGDIKAIGVTAVSGAAKTSTIKITSLKLNFGGSESCNDNGGGNGGGGGEGNDGYIELVSDDYGSDWDTDGEFLNNTPEAVYANGYVSATFELEARDKEYDGDDWPWGMLANYLEHNFVGLEKIVVEYEASENINITLGHTGGEWYESFSKKLNKATAKTEVEVLPSQLIRNPDAPSSYTGTLDLSKVTGVFFGPDGGYGKSVTIKLHSVQLYGISGSGGGGGDGPGGPDPISKLKNGFAKKNIAITGIAAGKIGLNVPTTGNYSIAVYSVDGRMLAQTKANLVQGKNSLALGKNLAKGVAIVRIQGANAAMVKKISIK